MSDNPLLKGKVPARYIAEHEIVLSPAGRPYFDAQGKPLKSLRIRKGDTLHINESEARGETWWHDPRREKDSERIGTGKKVKAEHADLTEEERAQIGYEHHSGRGDFEEITSSGRRVEQATQVSDPTEVSTLSEVVAPQIAEGYATEAGHAAESAEEV
jgi:hypothetical protein